MIASDFLDYISKFQVATYVGVEDFADKFNFLITVVILLLCSTVVTVKQYMMKPISCYMATDIGGRNLLDYVENYCWVQGTIPISYAGRIPDTEADWEELEKQKLLYYQWVPFVLGLQCVLFYLPRVIWQMICYSRSGTDIEHLVLSANQAVHATDEQRTKMVQHVARTLEQLLFQYQKLRAMSRSRYYQSQNVRSGLTFTVTEHPSFVCKDTLRKTSKASLASTSHRNSSEAHKEPTSWTGLCCAYLCRVFCFFDFDHHRGVFLSVAYLFTKLLYLANAIGQLFIMQIFLGFSRDQTFFGYVLLNSIARGQDWQATMVFPRVAFCYAPIRHLGTTANTATAQCVLPVNMLNEKIYIFLWWWILLMAVVTLLSLLRWLLQMLSQSRGTDFVKRFLMLKELLEPADVPLAEHFAKSYLRRDGIFLLRMISFNAGDMITADILAAMWSKFIELNSDGALGGYSPTAPPQFCSPGGDHSPVRLYSDQLDPALTAQSRVPSKPKVNEAKSYV